MKKLIILVISILFIPMCVNAESHYLYDVLKNEAESNGLAKEYTREHHDSFTEEPTHKIYHWYASTADEGNSINNKNNIILGDYCWKIIRTTDTGGVRVLYNGPVTEGKCPGNNISIGNAQFSSNENFYYLGATGYMHNELHSPYSFSSFNFGSINQKGSNLALDEYNVVSNKNSNNTCQPYNFNSSNKWELNLNCIERKNSIIFKVKEDGDYILNYDYDQDWTYDEVIIYKNDDKINNITTIRKSSIVLRDLNVNDEIKVEFVTLNEDDQRTELTFYLGKPTGEIVDTRYNFANDVDYSNGTYTLVNPTKRDSTENLGNTHYFCVDGSTTCNYVLYLIRWTDSSAYFIEFCSGNKLETLINDQLHGDNTNVINSPLKDVVDTWYENNLINYNKYFEDTIYCQKRNLIDNNNFLNKDGGNGIAHFIKEYSHPNSTSENYLFDSTLKCDYENDMYSISNPKAKLKYPIALLSHAEALLLSNGTYEQNGGTVRKFERNDDYYSYWLLTPYNTGINTYGVVVNSYGGIDYNYGANINGVRPVISLIPEISYMSGDGSTNNPYILDLREKHSIDVEINNETEDLTVEIDDLSQVKEGEEVNFKVTPIKGRKLTNLRIIDEDNNEIDYTTTDNKNYKFTMPSSDVTIIPTYERVKNSVNVEDNKNTKDFIIEVNDSQAVVYEDTVRFRLNPEEGYEVERIDITDEQNNKISYKKTNTINEYEFTMPDTNVLIKPYYRLINKSNLPNPDTKRQILLIVISIIILGIITTIYLKKKKIIINKINSF